MLPSPLFPLAATADVACAFTHAHIHTHSRSPRPQVTVSTVGLVEEMRQFAATSRAVMAVSLHATTDEVRDWIVPVNRKHGLQVRGGRGEREVGRREGVREGKCG